MTQITCRWHGYIDTADHDDTVCYWERQREIYERGAATARRELANARRQLSEQTATMTTSQTTEE